MGYTASSLREVSACRWSCTMSSVRSAVTLARLPSTMLRRSGWCSSTFWICCRRRRWARSRRTLASSRPTCGRCGPWKRSSRAWARRCRAWTAALWSTSRARSAASSSSPPSAAPAGSVGRSPGSPSASLQIPGGSMSRCRELWRASSSWVTCRRWPPTARNGPGSWSWARRPARSEASLWAGRAPRGRRCRTPPPHGRR
mmetsp:Transcript_93925/g.265800  ORF Transcript_93925/g.265800 Transcript_93925/m.265800 type:complete len:200 (+) Transcript_93925:407-1006(+)